MKRLSQKLSGLTDKKGVSVILTLMVLLILFAFTAAMLFFFNCWQKTAHKMYTGKNAQRFAKTGMEAAIWEIDNDDTQYDAFTDSWRTNFEGEDVDLNDDGVPDARWLEVKDREGNVIGRYAVLVEDESGKINVNYSGGSGKIPSYGVTDIDILSEIIGRGCADGIVRYREKRPYIDPADVKLVNGINQEGYDKIKNYITCFSYDLNVSKEGKYRLNLNDAPFEEICGVLRNLGYDNTLAVQIALNITAYRDKSRVPPVFEISGEKIFGVNKTPYFNEVDAVRPWRKIFLGDTIIFKEEGGQFIELFNPYSEALDIGNWKITGLVTLFSGMWKEVLQESQDILDDITAGETDIAPERVKKIIDNVVAANVIIPGGKKIPPRSFFTIGDLISIMIIIIPGEPPVVIPLFIPIREPDGCGHYEPILALNPGSLGFLTDILDMIPFLSTLGLDCTLRLYDKKDNLIEETEYIIDLPRTTVQKNDPRMFGKFDWLPGPPTPGKPNVTFQPWIGWEFGKVDWLLNWPSSFNVKNGKFVTLEELSLIHKKEHWKTLDFWKTGYDRPVLDYFTVVEKPEAPTYGRLNINTSSPAALACLPLADEKLAKAIIGAGPYKDISEVLGRYAQVLSPAGILSREMTKYGFDFRDSDFDFMIDTEKEKELIFSRIINLITVRSNVFKITALGQKVQNVNNNGKIEEHITAEKKLTVWYDRKKKRIIHKREIQ